MEQVDTNHLERLIDVYGLTAVIEELSTLCSEKADHLRTNWQDTRATKRWERAAAYLDKVSAHKTIDAVSL